MNKYRYLLALAMLVIASLACNLLSGSGVSPTGAPNNNTAPTAESGGGNVKTDFPLPGDVKNMTDLGNGAINFQTSMKMTDVVAFYRDAFTKQGFKEREILTSITDTTASLVFDGHPSGKAIVLQLVDLGNGTTNVNLRFEDV